MLEIQPTAIGRLDEGTVVRVHLAARVSLIFVTWLTTQDLQMNGAQSHTRFGERTAIMAMALTRDERLVLRYRASGRGIEEIAATLNWPHQAVRWTCTHPLIAWVLDELEASTTPANSPRAGREVSQGREIGRVPSSGGL